MFVNLFSKDIIQISLKH